MDFPMKFFALLFLRFNVFMASLRKAQTTVAKVLTNFEGLILWVDIGFVTI